MRTEYFGVGVVSDDGDLFHILCTDTHATINEARECWHSDPDHVREIQKAWAKAQGVKLCIIRVEITAHPLTDG